MLMECLSRLRFYFGKSRADVDDELQFHIERQTEANLAAGMPAAQARREAILSFGGREQTREQCREQRPAWFLEMLLRDVRFGLRGLWRNPGFTIVAVLTLALAIGANTSIFSLLDQALLRALPVPNPDQLVVLSFAGANPGHTQSDGGNVAGHRHEFSYPMYRDLRRMNTVFSGLIADAPVTIGVTWNNHAEPVSAELVSGDYFETLGVRPAVGRLFHAADETVEGANPVAVLNFDYWKAHLAEAPVVGKTLLINGTPFTITGVADPGFHSMVWGRMPEVYVPITMQRIAEPHWAYLNDRQAYWLNLVGRLSPSVSAGQAEAALNPLFLALRASEFPHMHDQSEKARKGFLTSAHLNLEAGAKGFSPLRGDVRTPLVIVMGMVLLVIGIAIVNVASLLLVRAASRVREFSMRYALGATSAQILRQLLVEGMLLGVGGACVGLLFARQVLQLLTGWISRESGQSVFSAQFDWRVLLFAGAATITASVLFSLAPAVQFFNPRLLEALKQQSGTGAGGSLRFRRTCVALQIGFSFLLVIAAGLFVRTIQNLRNVDAGFQTDHLLAFNLAPELAGYPPSQIGPLEQRALADCASLPGVRAVGATNDADLSGDNREGDVIVSGYAPGPDESFDVELPWVSDGYLQALGIPLVAGRYFISADTATSQKVAIVNESFARHFAGSPTAILGRHVSRPHRPATDAEIVGVVRDVKHTTVRDPVMPTSYIPFIQGEKPTGLTIYVRTWQPPERTSNSIRAAIANIDSRLVVGDLKTMSELIDDSISGERVIALLASAFAILATLLAGIGLYGILAYSTVQRTREIGIRMALGAQRKSVVGMIVREVMVLAGTAMVATIPLCILGTRAVRSQLFGVSGADAGIYSAGILIICFVAALAGFIPARRAASVVPSQALRSE